MQIKLVLNGKEINLTSENVKIKSNYFNVDKDGKVIISDNGNTETTNAHLVIETKQYNSKTSISSGGISMKSSNTSITMRNVENINGIMLSNGNMSCGMMTTDFSSSIISSDGNNKSTITATEIVTPMLTQTSSIEKKKNIEKLDKKATNLIKNADICMYHLKSEKDENKKHIGLVIGNKYNCPDEVISEDKQGIEQYSMISLAWKAIQELIKENEEIKQRIEKLEAK